MVRPRVTAVDDALDAAARMLAHKGIAATTVDDVAAEAGVSRATVYRYLGGKDEIVAAVIDRETQELLQRIKVLVPQADTARELVQSMVTTAVEAVEDSPVLARLNNEDRRETLPFITVDGAGLIDGVVTTLAPILRSRTDLVAGEEGLEAALEEVTRLVLCHLTTPRRDGGRLAPAALGVRVAAMVGPLLED